MAASWAGTPRDRNFKAWGVWLDGTQEVLANAFETWTLLRPGAAIYADGTYDLTVTLLTGTNSAFRKAHIQVRQPLDARRLYLLNGTAEQALELAPLIQMMPGPRTGEDICYFYSRLNPDRSVRWVSYHSTADPELVTDDPGVVSFVTETPELSTG